MSEIENRGIEVSIISFEQGLQSFAHAEVIRIHSKDYKLMIMQDHAPILGEVDGDIIILEKEKETKMEGIKGFFTLIDNHFKFIRSNEV